VTASVVAQRGAGAGSAPSKSANVEDCFELLSFYIYICCCMKK